MDKFKQTLSAVFDVQFADKFIAGALYYDSMDYIEYIKTDSIFIAERIDPFLTLLHDSNRTNVVGFRIKGIKVFFNEVLKPICELTDDHFPTLVSILQVVISKLGKDVVNDINRKKAYLAALNLANESGATVTEPLGQRTDSKCSLALSSFVNFGRVISIMFKLPVYHYSDCTIYNEPAYLNEPCNCGAIKAGSKFLPSLNHYACIHAAHLGNVLRFHLKQIFHQYGTSSSRAIRQIHSTRPPDRRGEVHRRLH